MSHESWLAGREERRLSISDPDDIKADIVAVVRENIDNPVLMGALLIDLVEALDKAEEEW